MKFTESDFQFVRETAGALGSRWTINVNKEAGVACCPGPTEDYVNPTVHISESEIKSNTGRSKLREVTIDRLVDKFNEYSMLSAERDGRSIVVSVKPQQATENNFTSLNQLKKKNQQELDEEPSLGNEPW